MELSWASLPVGLIARWTPSGTPLSGPSSANPSRTVRPAAPNDLEADARDWNAAGIGASVAGLAACARVARRYARSTGSRVQRYAYSAEEAIALDGTESGLPLFVEQMPFSEMYDCTLCKKQLTSKWDLNRHVATKQHLARVREKQLLCMSLDADLTLGKISSREPSNPVVLSNAPRRVLQGEEMPDFVERRPPLNDAPVCSYCCILCNTKLRNFELVLDHVNTEKHLKRIKTFEKEEAFQDLKRDIYGVDAFDEEGEDGEEESIRSTSDPMDFENPLRQAKTARRRGDIAFATEMVRKAGKASGGGRTTLLQDVLDEVPKLVRAAAREDDYLMFVEALALIDELDIMLDPATFMDILESLSVRVRPSPAILRLMLNLAVPHGQMSLDLFPEEDSAGDDDPLRVDMVFDQSNKTVLEGGLRMAKLEQLHGRVMIEDPQQKRRFYRDVSKAVLGFIEEVRQVLRRQYKSPEALERTGQLLPELTVLAAKGKRLTEYPSLVDLEPPLYLNLDKLKFSEGDYVVFSQTGPLADGASWIAKISKLPSSHRPKQDMGQPGLTYDGTGLPQYGEHSARDGYTELVLELHRGKRQDILNNNEKTGWRMDKIANYQRYKRRLNAILREMIVLDTLDTDEMPSGRPATGHFNISRSGRQAATKGALCS